MRKTRRIGIATKIILPSIIAVFIVGITIGYFSVNKIRTQSIQAAVSQAELVANMIAADINVNQLIALQPGDEETQEYEMLVKHMETLNRNNIMKFVYTLYKNEGNYYYGIDIPTIDNDIALIGEQYEDDIKELDRVYTGETVSTSIDYTKEFGYLITVYAPLYHESGEVVAVIGCDYDATNIMTNYLRMVVQIIVVMIICVLLVILALRLILTGVIKSICLVNDKLSELANDQGNLTQQVIVNSGDEMELISNHLNDFLNYIRNIVIQISGGSDQVFEIGNEILNKVEHTNQKTEEVSASMEEMSANMQQSSLTMEALAHTITEISSFVEKVSEKLNDGVAFSQEIAQQAKHMNEDVKKSKDHMFGKFSEMNERMKQNINSSKEVERIQELTQGIIAISTTTNLLSLNASIEAARAGESGKGFAIIADEIGKLAAISKNEAEQIQEVSNNIIRIVGVLGGETQKILDYTEYIMREMVERYLKTEEKYQENSCGLERMLLSLNDDALQLSGEINQIKNAMQEVRKGIESNTQEIVNVTTNTLDIQAMMQSVDKLAQRNNEVVYLLKDEVNKFIIE